VAVSGGFALVEVAICHVSQCSGERQVKLIACRLVPGDALDRGRRRARASEQPGLDDPRPPHDRSHDAGDSEHDRCHGRAGDGEAQPYGNEGQGHAAGQPDRPHEQAAGVGGPEPAHR
jgi:hypothetical protein